MFYSEDLIEGILEDGSSLRMSQVHTQVEETTTDSDGHTTTSYVTTFLGLYGVITLKTATKADFMIKNNSDSNSIYPLLMTNRMYMPPK